MAITIQDGFSVRTTVPVDARFVADTVVSMNAMEAEVRYEGLTCYVVENGVLYHLKGGILNANWLPVGEGNVSGPTGPVLGNSVPVFNGTSGKELKSTPVNIDAYGGITGVSEISAASALLGSLRIAEIVNSGSSGENVTIPITYGRVVLTNSSLVSIAEISTSFMINPMSVEVTLHNRTGNKIILVHDYISASEAILLPYEKDLTIPNEGSVTLVKSSQAGGKFIIKGGAGGGQGSLNSSQLTLLTADDSLTDWDYTSSFTISKANPIHGEASYSLGMTTGENAKHKLIPVYPFFRRSNLAFLISYRGVSVNPISGSAKAVIYDQADEKIAEWSLPAITSEIQKFGKTFFMPPSTTGVRVQIESTSTVVDEFIQFDNIEIASDILKSVNIEGDYQSEILTNVGALTQTTNLAAFSSIQSIKNSEIYTKSSQGIVFLRDASVDVIYTYYYSPGAWAGSSIYLNGVSINETSAQSNSVPNPVTLKVKKDDKITFLASGGGADASRSKIQIKATSRTESIVAPMDQVTERSIAWKWKATALTASDPVGAYNTYTYAAGTNTKTLATTRPTQTDADMSVNGVRIFTRTYNAASTAAQPARFEIKIAEPNSMAACDVNIFKDATRQVLGSLSYFEDGAGKAGLGFHNFNPNTGILTIDGGLSFNIAATLTVSKVFFDDGSFQTNGYITFTASKLAQAVAIPKTNPVAIIKDVKPAGTEGGTATAGAWYDRTLNSLENPYGIVSDLSASKFTLPKGRYLIEGFGCFMGTRAAQNRIIGSLGTEILGSAVWILAADSSSIPAPFSGIINLTSSEQFSLQYRVQDTKATYGLGGGGLGNTWASHSFAEIKITKLD